ncbi:MAG: F0F1 ATP synthase subunit A [Lachnospiraceae bacterium]|nr:F0F1 ATP synthase subunit A [Lachnospiraceae bacterium]
MEHTGSLGEHLSKELDVETVFTIFGLPVYESVVVTWIIMAVIIIACILLTRNLKVENPGKVQLFLESVFSAGYNFFYDILGENGKQYIGYLMTVILYIGFANIMGIFGFKSPTKDLNVTIALALMSIILIEGSALKYKGGKKFLKSFAEPIAIVAPINVLELVIRPLSLCMRLFGNVLGAFVIMELLKYICPVLLPVPFCLYFDIFDGLIQAYVFVFLTSLFMSEGLEE